MCSLMNPLSRYPVKLQYLRRDLQYRCGTVNALGVDKRMGIPKATMSLQQVLDQSLAKSTIC